MAWHLGFLVSWLVVFSSGFTEATTTRRMDDFISAVERTEAENPGLQMLDVVKGLRKAAGFETNLIKHHLGDLSDARDLVTDPSVISYLSKSVPTSLRGLNGVLQLSSVLPPICLSLCLFIHHTYRPANPCTTFEQCASEMRSMQRYHQQTNGWSDIGYSFVAGSDGNLYEGRGWNWVGAHTYGYNSRGYGVCFIGDYTSTLPSRSAINMVRYDFTSCAVNGGRLSSSYYLYGHRQADSTECPGNTLYRQIQTWERYQSYLP
uniref:Peptidoglycan recognition protein 6 isoform A n=1 Tax=Ctenopharyngodon idella TaxID=7959 RepID=A0A140WLY8_CTEID|nr:peptidoglycan recognition protein 6 isoform A [Ctenopharyngodon idella]